MVRSFDTLNILGLLFDVSKNGTEKSCNDSENMFALSLDVSKNLDLESYDIHGLENLFGAEGIPKRFYNIDA